LKKIVFIILLLGIYLSSLVSQEATLKPEGHVFDNLKDEYKLVSYFISTNQRRYYRKLDEKNKWEYISAFWKAQDPNPATESNEFLLEIKARIEYCNQHFSHFNKGWETDTGKVYIKYGKPFEVLKLNTGSGTKFAQKEYQIWKYRIKSYRTFIFIDLHQNESYRLIFSDGDGTEGSWADWRSYLGNNFSEDLLQ
jgi:GWxTD domain-containing protein